METIGDRLKEFAKDKYKSVTGLTRFLGMNPSALAPYIKGNSKPGHEIQEKLRKAGCDIEWLMTGKIKLHEAHLTDTQFCREIGERLVLFRKALEVASDTDYSKMEFAYEIGITNNDLTHYEMGDAYIPHIVLSRLYFMRCNIIWLLTGKGFPIVEYINDIESTSINFKNKWLDIFKKADIKSYTVTNDITTHDVRNIIGTTKENYKTDTETLNNLIKAEMELIKFKVREEMKEQIAQVAKQNADLYKQVETLIKMITLVQAK